jgi:hypothetical protein
MFAKVADLLSLLLLLLLLFAHTSLCDPSSILASASPPG